MHGVSKMDTFEQVALISFKKIPFQTGLIADIFGHYGRNGINVDMISQTSPIGNRVSLSFTCQESDMVKVLAISNKLKETYPDLLPMVSSGNGKIFLSGEEMRKTPGVFARVMECLSKTQAEPLLVSTSEIDISVVVAAAHLEEARLALKAEFAV